MNSDSHVLSAPQALRCCFGTSRSSSVLHNFATSGHLVFQPNSLSNPFTSSSIVIPGIQNVRPFARQLHRQAPMAQELVDSSLPLVHRCRRLQTSRTQVILAHPRPHRERLKQGLGLAGTGCHRQMAYLLNAITVVSNLPGALVLRRSLATGWIEPHTNQPNRFDDLIPEESENVQRAIKRLPAKEAYDRVFRIRRAFQVRPNPFLISGPRKV